MTNFTISELNTLKFALDNHLKMAEEDYKKYPSDFFLKELHITRVLICKVDELFDSGIKELQEILDEYKK
jgi:hypothetical protein